MIWFPFPLVYRLDIGLHHPGAPLLYFGWRATPFSRNAAGEKWPWGHLHTTGIVLYTEPTCLDLLLCPWGQVPTSCSWAPAQGKSPITTWASLSHRMSYCLGREGDSWNHVQIPQLQAQSYVNICLWGLWDLPWVILLLVACSRGNEQSYSLTSHKAEKNGMPGSSSDLMLEEKVLLSTFWHDYTPLSPSYSSWTLSSSIIPLLTTKVLFPSLPSLCCAIRERHENKTKESADLENTELYLQIM